MSPDAELMLIFGTLHLIAVALGVGLFVLFLRSESQQGFKPPDEDDGGGGNDRVPGRPKTSTSGGVPLPVPLPARAHPPPARGVAAPRPRPAQGAAALARATGRPPAGSRAPSGPRAG